MLKKLKERRTQVVIAIVLLAALLVVVLRDDFEIVQLVESNPSTSFNGAYEFRFPQALGRHAAIFHSVGGQSSGVFRIVNEQIERISEKGQDVTRLRGFHALVGETVFYVGYSPYSTLFAVEKGAARTIAKYGDKISDDSKFGRSWCLDSDGKTLAFDSEYSPHILTVRDGQVAVLLHVEKRDGGSSVNQISVDGEFVYILRRGFSNEIVRGKGAEIRKLIRAGDQVADGTIDSLYGVCAVDGKVAVNGYLKSNDQGRHVILWYDGEMPEVIWRQELPSSTMPDNAEFVCTNGESVAFIEASRERVEITSPGFAPWHVPLSRLFINRKGANHVIVKVGDGLFGSTLVRIGLGPRSMDSDGNVAFTYKLADDRCGIAIARLKD